MLRFCGEPHPSRLNVKERIGWRTLLVYVLVAPIVRDLAAQAGSGTEPSKGSTHLVHAFHIYCSAPEEHILANLPNSFNMSCIKVNRCLQEEIAFGSQSESARRKPAAISIFRIQKNTVNRTSKDDHFSIALIRLQLSCQNAQCIKLHRQLYSVCLLWVRKRRGENVRDRKAGLGRVLFTSSSFRGFRMVEIEPFGRRC